MRQCTDRFLAAIKTNHTAISRVTVLRNGEPVMTANTVASGNVNFDSSAASRGRVDLSLFDDGTLGVIPLLVSDPLAPYGNEIQVERGIRFTDGTTEYMGLGIYRIDDVQVGESGAGLTVSVAGLDRSASCIDATFEDPYQVNAGDNYVQAILAALQDGVPGLSYNFSDSSVVAPQLIAQEGSNRWEFCQKMANAIGMDLYFDGDGVCNLSPVSGFDSDPVWAVVEGVGGLLLGATRRWSRQGAANKFIYTGENTGGAAPFRGEASDDNPTSPTFYGGVFGKVPRFVSSPMISSDAQAQDAASAALARELGTTQSIDFGSLVNPALEVGDMIEIARARAGINESHIIDKMTIPLASGEAMSGTTRATVSNG